jgi:pimeloyl-ACP methyl ester carboxylesterase
MCFCVLSSPRVSFSGPLAVMLALGQPKRVKGVILVATFVQVPRPWLRLLRFACNAPMLWIWRVTRRIPMWAPPSGDDPLRLAKAEAAEVEKFIFKIEST